MDFLAKQLSYVFGLFILFFSFHAHSVAKPIVCNQPYALCTSARCIPLAESLNEAICECVTERGASIGFTSCEKRKPKLNKYKTISLVSTFSFVQFTTKKSMNCPQGMPWTNCVDMPCTVDPQNKKRALCKCKINNTKAFFTFGGDCNADSCATGFWSGATPENSTILRKTLLQSIKSNMKPLVCGANKDKK